MFTHFFIKRPIFSTVIALLIFCLGAVTYSSLPVEQFPNVVPPTVVVTAEWPGASAEDIVDSIAIPIEEVVNGVDNMIYMESKSTSNGKYSLTVTFDIGVDPDISTTLVQNRVAQATASLPNSVKQIGLVTKKQSTNLIAVVNIYDRPLSIANDNRIAEIKTKAYDKLAKETGYDYKKHFNDSQKKSWLGQLFDMLRGEKSMSDQSTAQAGGDWKFDEQGRVVNTTTKEIHEPATRLFLTNYANNFVKDELARINGVGDVTLHDLHIFSMRIWLDNDLMASREITATEVQQVILTQNNLVSAGRIGAAPAPEGQQTNIVMMAAGRLTSVDEFKNIVLRVDEAGRTLHLGDIARIERDAQSYLTNARIDGIASTSLGISQLPGANEVEVANLITKRLQELKEDFHDNGLEYEVSYDSTEFVKVSINEVLHTLIEAVFIVVFIVYVFLQNWRAAIIPTLTVPVSLVGSFFLMQMFGFTLNTLTLFGLVLVIGIVVDDSILVVENTQRILDEERGITPYDATKKSMLEMAGPVIGTTCVLMAVFVPTALTPGMIGQLYKQFALTIASAVGISGVCALTFAPALSCVLLRADKSDNNGNETGKAGKRKLSYKTFLTWIADTLLTTVFAHLVLHIFHVECPIAVVVLIGAILFCPLYTRNGKQFFFNVFNVCFNALTVGYKFLMGHLAKVAIVVLLLWGAMVYGLGHAFSIMPTGFLPAEDQGVLFFDVTLPQGASDERTAEVLEKAIKITDENRAGIKHVITISGNSMLNGTNLVNCGMGYVILDDWSQRTMPGLSADDIQRRLMQAFAAITEAQILVFQPPPIHGIGTSGGLELRLLDQTNNGSFELAEAGQQVLENTVKSGNVMFGQSLFDPSAPRFMMEVDRESVARLFLNENDVNNTITMMVGSMYVNDYNEFDKVYRVTVQAAGEFRSDIDSVLNMQVRNSQGKMVTFRSFAKIVPAMGPEVITRYNLFQATPIVATPSPSKSSGQAIAAVEAVCKDLPAGFKPSWTGMTYQENAVGSQQYAVFGMSILFAFMILAALYENWSSPVIIMMAVPLGVMGALMAVALFGMPINMYTQVGLIIMVGLSAKNAILITEVAREVRANEHKSVQESAIEAGHRRMRPIMMTSYAFILGVIPLAIATGAGALGRNAIGRAVCGGMINETMIGIFVTPALFILLQSYSEWYAKLQKKVIGETGNDGT